MRAFAALVGVTVLGLWPWMPFAGVVPGPAGDQAFYVWMYDTVVRNLLAGRPLFWTDRIFYPIGYNLLLSTATPVLAVLAVPFLASLPQYTGAVMALSLPLGMGSVMGLVRVLGGTWSSGILLGILYALGPVRAAILRSHVGPPVAAALVPLVVLTMCRAAAVPTWRRLGWVVVAEWITMTMYPYYGWVAILVSTGAVLSRPSRALFWRGSVVLLANMVALALVSTTLEPVSMGRLWNIGNADIRDFARAMMPVAPAFLGWQAWAWVPALLTCAALAVGGCLRLGTEVWWTASWFPWPWLATHWVTWGIMDLPRYFVLGIFVASIPLVVSASRTWREFVTVWLVGAVGVTVVTMPVMPVYRLGPSIVPIAYQVLAAEPPGTVLELPGGLVEAKGGLLGGQGSANEMMYFQTIHKHRRIGGYVSRIPAALYDTFGTTPVLGDLLIRVSGNRRWKDHQVQHLPSSYPPEVMASFLLRFDLRYLLIDQADGELAAELRQLFQGRVLWERLLGSHRLFHLAVPTSTLTRQEVDPTSDN